MDSAISRAEHEEFVRRMEADHKRTSRRLDILEDSVREIAALTTSVEKLAQSVESMALEQGKQSRRLEELEDRDGENYRKLIGYIGTTVIGILVGFFLRQFGIF